jgi:heptosyltransferase-2
MRIAVLLPNWIGDVVMATPALRALHRRFGREGQLIGVMRPYVADVLRGLPWLDDSRFYDPRSSDPDLRLRSLVRQLRRDQLDLMVLMTNSLRSGFIGWLSGATRRVGYVRYGRGPLLTEKLQAPRNGRQLRPISALDYYLQLTYAVGCSTESRDVELATTSKDEETADAVWSKYGLSSARHIVTLNPGGAYGAAKHWPTEYFADLATRLVHNDGVAVVVLCGPREQGVALEIERRAARSRVVSLGREQPSIGLSKACIRRSQMLVTTDSGPRHIAAAFNVPSIALFGATDPRWSWNYHAQETILQQSLECVPCGQRTCPLEHHRCMQELTPGKVYGVVQRRLGLKNSKVA